jgi:CIC family chloride channel protein
MLSERKEWIRLTLLGIVSGFGAGAAVLLLRGSIDHGQMLFLPDAKVGNYEGLEVGVRFLLPVVGALLLGIAFEVLPPHLRQVGVLHVLRMLRRPGGERLPAGNMLVQLLAGTFAIVSGNSVDREGPAVHIGSASASLVGQSLGVSREESYTLAAAGAAAAIAAAFNTPLAGIVFVIEVLRVRYDVSRYIPILSAAVVGAVFSGAVHGTDPAFTVPGLTLGSLWRLPSLVILGLFTGMLAIAFITLCEQVTKRAEGWRPSISFTVAGLVTGVLSIWTPQIMGLSYDTLDALLKGAVELKLVAAILVAKLVATAVAVGVRIPGGLIGPTLFIGGAAGSAVGLLAATWNPVHVGSASFYALVGMVSMMGATLRAPLAALTALLELTWTPNVILPGMVTVVSAELTNRLVLGKDSVFETLIKLQPVVAARRRPDAEG